MEGMDDSDRGLDPNNEITGTKGAIDPYTGVYGTPGTPVTTGFGMSGSTIGIGYHAGRRIWEEARYGGGLFDQDSPASYDFEHGGLHSRESVRHDSDPARQLSPVDTSFEREAPAVHADPRMGIVTISGVSIVALLQPGQTEAWKDFAREMYGPRHEEYKASRRRLGITREKVLLVPTTQGDLTIAYVEAAEPGTLFTRMAASQEPFDIWFAERIRSLYGADFQDPPIGPTPSAIAHDSIFEWQTLDKMESSRSNLTAAEATLQQHDVARPALMPRQATA